MQGVTLAAGGQVDVVGVSIHTPYAGSDVRPLAKDGGPGRVSIHTPYAGSDMITRALHGSRSRFQSTLPMQGVTRPVVTRLRRVDRFNPHSLCRE